MKRLFTLVLAMLLTLSLAACGGQGDDAKQPSADQEDPAPAQTDSAAPTPAANSKYVLTYKDCPLPMNADFAPLLAFLGEPDSYFEAASCAFDGLDKTYTYAGLEIVTYPDEDVDRISSVRILDNSVSTPEGVTIGSSMADVAAACGEDYEEVGLQHAYEDGDAVLSVLFDGDTAVSVEYTAINDLLG